MADPRSEPKAEARRPVGLILAGGLARRMGGGDKGLRQIGGRSILDHVIDRAAPQVAALALNANGDADRFARWGVPVVPDPVPDHPGPLAGVLAGLDWAATAHPDAGHVVTLPCDAPFLPRDLVARLMAPIAAGAADLTCAESDGRAHPVVGLWPVALRATLRQALVTEGVRKVDVWTARFRLVRVPFAADPVDPFFNANRPEDLAEAERLVAHHIG